MKRIIKKIIVVLLCCVVTIIYVPSGTVEVIAIEDLISVEDIDVDFYNKQSESIKQYENLLNSFNENRKNRNNEQVYDENFGGAYIDDNGELVVLLVNQDENSVDKMKTYANNDSLRTMECEYSFNELLSVINSINNNLEYLRKNGVIIMEMYEDVYSNRVHIGVADLTEDMERIILDIVDSKCMYIYNQTESAVPDSTVYIQGGDEIFGNEDSSISTLGFCATRNNEEGFVIAGHAGDMVRKSFRTSSGMILGFVTATAYYNNTSADAAFITKSSADFLNTTDKIYVYRCNNLATHVNHYPAGTVVCKYGITTGQTSGKIKCNFFTGNHEGLYFTDHVSADYDSDAGDSGGPVYVVQGVVNGNVTCQLLGIHSSSSGERGDSLHCGIFAKYMNIVNELDITAITYSTN